MTEQILGSLNKTIAEKKKEKYDTALEKKIRENLGHLLPEYKEQCENSQIPFQELLKDGIILCLLMNKIVPGKISKVNTTKLAFKQMENIANYLKACQQIGFQEIECFETNDLFEGRDMISVLNHLNLFLTMYEKHGEQFVDYMKQRKPEQTPSGGLSGTLSPVSKQQESSRMQPLRSPRSPAGTDKSVPIPVLNSPDTQEKKRPTFWGTGASGVAPTNASVSSLEHDIATKEEFKYSPELERAARQWIEKIVGDVQPNLTFSQYLKSGVVLCKLMNALKPGIIPKINEQNIAYMQMENIERYLQACKELGLRDSDLFNTSDLFNEKNMNFVINNIHILAHFVEKLPEYNGPKIEATQSRNLFSASLVESSAMSFLQEDPNAPIEPLTPEQKDVFDWANKLLKANAPEYLLKNLSTDVRNGIKLLKLIEIVAKVPSVGSYNKEPRLLWHCMQNATLILRFLAQQTFERVEGCRATDIVMGRTEAIVKLLQFIRAKFDLDYMYKRLIGDEEELESGEICDQSKIEDIVEEIELQPGQEIPEHLKQYVTSIEERYPSHQEQVIEEQEIKSSLVSVNAGITNVTPLHTPPSQTLLKEEIVKKEKKPKEQRHRDKQKTEKHARKSEMVIQTTSKSPGKRRKSDADSHKKMIKEVLKEKGIVKEEPIKPKKTSKREANRTKGEQTKTKEATKEEPIKTKEEPIKTKKATKEEPIKAKEEPIKAKEEPIKTKEEPIKTKEEPIKVKEEPIKAKEEPIKVKEEPIKTKEEPIKVKEEPIKTKEVTKEEPIKTKEVTKEEPIKVKEESIKAKEEPIKTKEEPIKTKEVTKEEPQELAREELQSHTSIQDRSKSPSIKSQGSDNTNQKPATTQHVREMSTSIRKVVLRRPGSRRQMSMSQEPEKALKIQKAQTTMRQHVANEILQTERSYVKSLTILNERLIQQTKRMNIMSDQEFASAFSNLPDLVEHHKKFESILASRIQNWNETSRISDIFLEQIEFFKDYKPYLSNYNSSIISIHYLKKKYPAFAQLINNFEEEQMATTMFNTESFLIMPVQRIPRYVLLLKDMRKYVAPTSEEHSQLGKAIENIEKTLQELNSNIPQTAIEDTKKVLQIADSIEGEENILAPQRVYIKEGPIHVKKIKENKRKGHVIKATTESVKKLWEFFTKKKVQPYWFLFNDLLVYCDVKPQAKSEDTKQFTFVTSISLNDLKEIGPTKKSSKETDFQLVLESEVWQLSCQSAEEKKDWVEEIKKCLEQLRKQNVK